MPKSLNVKRQPLTIPTYGVGKPEKNPLFFEKRVYQGSSGKVYPVPFIDKVYDTPEAKEYDSISMENDYVKLVLLPELGGRIYLGQDKSNNDYDFFYRNDVIKPALVGLAGPWLSGGVEFNWPQHHRPGTFMPADTFIEEEPDGSTTVWMSEHDPLNRLKGMHGIHLKPESNLIELRGRLYNRTSQVQTFLWWANVAAEVHDQYQSFFPTDVSYVADHAARAMSSFPKAEQPYYGVEYQNKPEGNDLTWYRNIPVPTSYMICDTKFDFFGGYDHKAGGGFVHVANRHISPGKKQWTWGNHEFGWAWDRELTDDNGPYIELMAGVYTDNQPDFSYLLPYETKTFSQYWWPYKDLGPVQQADNRFAIKMIKEGNRLQLGVASSGKEKEIQITLRLGGSIIKLEETLVITPDTPWQKTVDAKKHDVHQCELLILDATKVPLLSYRPAPPLKDSNTPDPAQEPLAPGDVSTVEELYFIGEHLELYRHPTRTPILYWEEGIRREPHDQRCHLALGKLWYTKGDYTRAEKHLRISVERITSYHPNPSRGEAHYYLGLCCRALGNFNEAYDLFYKSSWNGEYKSAALYEVATLDACRGDYYKCIEHTRSSLACNTNHSKARALLSIALCHCQQKDESRKVLVELLALDPLDHIAHYQMGILTGDLSDFWKYSRNDAQTILDCTFDLISMGEYRSPLQLLLLHHQRPASKQSVPNPLSCSLSTHYLQAWLQYKIENKVEAIKKLETIQTMDQSYFFPSRIQELDLLLWAQSKNPHDPVSPYGLGNLLYDKGRHADAIFQWKRAVKLESLNPTLYRNLGIASWNHGDDREAARTYYKKAVTLAPDDARVLTEYDQLRRKSGDDPQKRLATFLGNMDLVLSRDDAIVALADLYTRTDQPEKSLELLEGHRFHPWEGGEGQVLKQYTTARLALGKIQIEKGCGKEALVHFEKAMDTPTNLGESYHLLQAKADVLYWQGKAQALLGKQELAEEMFRSSAQESGDFQGMAVIEYSELSYYNGLSLMELGKLEQAKTLFTAMIGFAKKKREQEACIDYFATSLPLLLVLEDDLNQVQREKADLIENLATQGLSRISTV